MMIEPLYDFSLTAEQEARARTLHESSIILDMLFQGPVGTYSLPEGAEEELLALAQEACPGDEIAQCNWATAEILRRMIGGSYSQLYKDCWYDSGLTGGCRQLSVTDRDEALRSAVELQAEFDTYPWLVKCTSVEQIRRCKKEGLKAGIVTSQEAEGYSKDLKLLELLYNYGLRVQQLSYNNQNLIGAGCMEPNGGAGLSKFGIRFVEKCNELGIPRWMPASTARRLSSHPIPAWRRSTSTHAARAMTRSARSPIPAVLSVFSQCRGSRAQTPKIRQ